MGKRCEDVSGDAGAGFGDGFSAVWEQCGEFGDGLLAMAAGGEFVGGQAACGAGRHDLSPLR